MEPGPALPPEIYRLNAQRMPWVKGRARRRISVLVALATTVVAGVVTMDAPSLHAALDAVFGVGVLAAALAPYALWSAGHRVRRTWNAFELAVGSQFLRVVSPGVRNTVLRSEVVKIVERADGLVVRSTATSGIAFVPVEIEAYADVRARLAAWSPIIRRRSPRIIAAVLVLGGAVAGGAYLALTAAMPAVAVAGFVFVTSVGSLAVVDIALQPALLPGTKILLGAVAAAALIALFTQVIHRFT